MQGIGGSHYEQGTGSVFFRHRRHRESRGGTGESEEPLFAYLKAQRPDEKIEGLKNKASMAAIEKLSVTCKKTGDIKWNFTKFLVDRAGNVVKRFAPTTDPMSFESDIAALI